MSGDKSMTMEWLTSEINIYTPPHSFKNDKWLTPDINIFIIFNFNFFGYITNLISMFYYFVWEFNLKVTPIYFDSFVMDIKWSYEVICYINQNFKGYKFVYKNRKEFLTFSKTSSEVIVILIHHLFGYLLAK